MEHKGDTRKKKTGEGRSLEQTVAETLEFGIMRKGDPEQEAVNRLSPRYEIRIKAQLDPIVEETEHYRSMATEVDDRYDSYLKSAGIQGQSGDGRGS